MRSNYLFFVLAGFSALVTAVPVSNSDMISTESSTIQKRGRTDCTLHYTQQKTADKNGNNGNHSDLKVFGPKPNSDPKSTAPDLGLVTPSSSGGAFTPLPGYGDFLLAVDNADNSVTFRRHGSVSKDTWTIKFDDKGEVGLCNVGAWADSSRQMDCGFECVLL